VAEKKPMRRPDHGEVIYQVGEEIYQADHGEVIYQVEEWSVTEILQVVALYSVRKRRQAPACAPYAACGAPPMRGMLWREGTR